MSNNQQFSTYEHLQETDRPNLVRSAADVIKSTISAQLDKLNQMAEAQAQAQLDLLGVQELNRDLHLNPESKTDFKPEEEDLLSDHRPHSYSPARHEVIEPETVIRPEVDVQAEDQARRIAEARKLEIEARNN